MPKRMSCSITVNAVRDRTKTVTRRHANTWTTLKPGDHLTLIEKGMGLPRGAKQVVLAEVEIVSNTLEPLYAITEADCAAEGFPHFAPSDFIDMWIESHHIRFRGQDEAMVYKVRRIEWRYLDTPAPASASVGGEISDGVQASVQRFGSKFPR